MQALTTIPFGNYVTISVGNKSVLYWGLKYGYHRTIRLKMYAMS